MIERIEDMPVGTFGFSASGKLTRSEYKDVLEPVLRDAAESGEIRMVFEIKDFKGLEPSAWYQDIKTGLGLGLGHHTAWKRSAIVTDIDWLAKAFEFFSWITPGEVMVWGPDQLEQAKTWAAG
jgi:hypothetical protein